MKKSILIAVVAVVVIVVVAAGVLVCFNPFAGQPAATPTPAPTEDVAEQARDAAIMYISTNHTGVAPMLSDLNWTGGRVETGLVGSETHTWISGMWNITVTHPVVPDPTYTICANYNDATNQVTIDWDGTYQNGVINETNYQETYPS